MKLAKLFCLIVSLFFATKNLAQIPRLIEHGALPPYAPYIANFAGFSDLGFDQGDLNNDGYPDLIICGDPITSLRECHVYLQDAKGNYWKTPSNNLTPVTDCSVHLEDLNGDTSVDLLLSGVGPGNIYVTELYLNDGKGNFVKQSGTPFIGVSNPNIVVGDVDGDLIPDVILSGRTQNNDILRWYKNDGSASFTYDSSSNFVGIVDGSINMEDLDGDGDNDLLVTGYYGYNPIKVYLNNGQGTFQELTQSFPTIKGNVVTNDFDFDGDIDFLISGSIPHYFPYYVTLNTLIFLNDGNGYFTQYYDSAINSFSGYIVLEEFTGDTVPDLLVIGIDSFGKGVSYLLEGRGDIGFNHYDTLAIPWLINAKLGAFHLDGDSLLDLLFIGYGESKYYLNRGTPSQNDFELVRNSPLKTTKGSVPLVHDFNGDQFPDILLSGTIESEGFFYINDGSGRVYLDTSKTFYSPNQGLIYLANMDADSSKELVLKTTNQTVLNASVFDQGANQKYSLAKSLDDLNSVFFNVGDFNGDKACEIIVQGEDDFSSPKLRFYKNDGVGNFSLDSSVVMDSLQFGSSAFGDIDGDLDLDILICGNKSVPVTRVYRNDGNGNFQLDNVHGIANFKDGRMQFLDLDVDGDQDLFITGTVRTGVGIYNYKSKIYLNNGSGQFTEKALNNLGAYYCPIFKFFDLNYDGYLDLYVAGYGSGSPLLTQFYLNDGNLNFKAFFFPNFFLGAAHLNVTDLEKDGKIELVVSGGGTNRLFTVLNCSTYHTLDSIYSCGSYKWINNIEYTSSNYSDSLILLNQEGCDSVIHLKLTIAYPDTSYLNETVCDSFLWLDGQKYHTDTLISYMTLTSGACDSLIFLDLDAVYPSNSYFSEVVCDSFLWLDSHYYFTDTLLLYTLTNASGCDSIMSMNIDRHDVETRVTQTSSALTAFDSSSSYQWLDCNTNYTVIQNAGNRMFQPTANGVYAVQIDDGVCIDTSNCVPFTSLATDNKEPAVLAFYPNPVHNELTLILPNLSGELELRDMNGKMVLQQEFNENKDLLTLDLKGIASGPYVLHLVTRDTSQFQIIIKE